MSHHTLVLDYALAGKEKDIITGPGDITDGFLSLAGTVRKFCFLSIGLPLIYKI
jgi:hypothetical protein